MCGRKGQMQQNAAKGSLLPDKREKAGRAITQTDQREVSAPHAKVPGASHLSMFVVGPRTNHFRLHALVKRCLSRASAESS